MTISEVRKAGNKMRKRLWLIAFLAGLTLLSLGFERQVYASEWPDVDLSVPIHGHWCGPGYGGVVENEPQPVDTLDYGCMKHDLCYAANGYFNASCDRELLDYIDTHKQYMGPWEKVKANLVYLTFSSAHFRD